VIKPFHFIFEQQNGQKEMRNTKTEIHSMMEAVDLEDFPNPQGIEYVRPWDDNNENNNEERRKAGQKNEEQN
jgi:hypothetical protein